MTAFAEGWRIQARVVSALMIREMHTHYGRENIGFLWIMVEPLMFAGLVATLWSAMGHTEHGLSLTTFVISGYIPTVLYRHSVTRCVWVFRANGGLLYHRQIKILDFVLVRFLLELIGCLMAYIAAIVVLSLFDIFPPIYDMGLLMSGFFLYAMFALASCLVLAPLSEMSEVVEKFIPVTLYISVPLSGAFFMTDWFSPALRQVLLYSPMVHMFEMMRAGIFGHDVETHYSYTYPISVISVGLALGLLMCRQVRAKLVIE